MDKLAAYGTAMIEVARHEDVARRALRDRLRLLAAELIGQPGLGKLKFELKRTGAGTVASSEWAKFDFLHADVPNGSGARLRVLPTFYESGELRVTYYLTTECGDPKARAAMDWLLSQREAVEAEIGAFDQFGYTRENLFHVTRSLRREQVSGLFDGTELDVRVAAEVIADCFGPLLTRLLSRVRA